MGLVSQNALSRSVTLFQVLPVLSVGSGFSVVVACCSHSSPSGSHWPCTYPLSSSLDGRSASPPSESCTQRCLCQRRSPALNEEVMVRLYRVLLVTQPQNIIPAAAFPHSSLHLFHPFLHYTLNKNAMEITEVQLLPQSLNHNCLSDSSFNLYLKSIRTTEVRKGKWSYRSSAEGWGANCNYCYELYHYLPGRK